MLGLDFLRRSALLYQLIRDFKFYYGDGDENVSSKCNIAQSRVFRGYIVTFTSHNVGEFEFIHTSSSRVKLFRASKRLFNQLRDDGLPPNLHTPQGFQ